MNCDEFLRGQRDAQKGEYKPDQSESYARGWQAQSDLGKSTRREQ